jgi:hypothetical protein
MFKVQFGRDLGQTLSERFKEPPFKQVGILLTPSQSANSMQY